MLTIGVLGGMGPGATALFFEYLIKLTPAHCDQDHIPVIICNKPRIPDRTAAVLGHGESPASYLLQDARLLERAGADFICMPCNTAHFFLPEFESQLKVPFLHQALCVRDSLLAFSTSLQRVGLLATKGTVRCGLYEKLLGSEGIAVVVPEAGALEELQRLIEKLKAGKKPSRQARSLINDLTSRGAEAVVLGCTELSLLAEDLSLPVPFFDSTRILAEVAVSAALADAVPPSLLQKNTIR